jgi:hypothetical protein
MDAVILITQPRWTRAPRMPFISRVIWITLFAPGRILPKRGTLMSASGQSLPKWGVRPHVCFALDSDGTADIQDRQLRAQGVHTAWARS